MPKDGNPEGPTFLGKAVRWGLHAYWRVSRGMTLGVRAAVIDEEGRVFLVRHTYTPGWHLPGGGVEAGETALEAMTRELREEACIVADGDIRLHGLFFNRYVSRRDHVLVYVVRSFRLVEVKRPDREIAEAGFFPLHTLPDGTTGGTRRRLLEIAGEASLSAYW